MNPWFPHNLTANRLMLCVPHDDWVSQLEVHRLYKKVFDPLTIHRIRYELDRLADAAAVLDSRSFRGVGDLGSSRSYRRKTKLPYEVNPPWVDSVDLAKNMLVSVLTVAKVTPPMIFAKASKMFEQAFTSLPIADSHEARSFWLDMLVMEGRCRIGGSLLTCTYSLPEKTNLLPQVNIQSVEPSPVCPQACTWR